MVIPSYFSYIIKNHSNIIRNRRRIKHAFSSLYMDCNSIIYDCVRKIENDTEPRSKGFNMEDEIIALVIAKIEHYVESIQPTNVLYIAFDGVAPFAKMEQQRIRRYKTGYLAALNANSNTDTNQNNGIGAWNTSSITPGTNFMNMLSLKVKRAFSGENGRFFGANKVVVSGSDEPGEGEHKMFQYMRDHAFGTIPERGVSEASAVATSVGIGRFSGETTSVPATTCAREQAEFRREKQTETIAVYGLDADLIMRSLFHCFACENIFIFRESPEFGRVLLGDAFGRDELLFLDHRALSVAILSEMGVTESTESRGRIYDYIFACFFLGNDFLPHFPALNIRTHGNYTILETYRKLFSRHSERRFICLETGNIQWRWVKMFLQELAKEEPKLILNEYESRAKMEKRFYPTTTKEERETAFENIPTIYRAEEHYIRPGDVGWEERYYKTAFHFGNESNRRQTIDNICNNYLEGLEWTFKYYTEGCPHWRWKYNYHYPPLFVDLVERLPNFETTFIDENKGINHPFHPHTQLAYVIPPWNHQLLPEKNRTYLEQKEYSKYYVGISELQFQWMFCKYFWESHAILPDFPIDCLETLDVVFLDMHKNPTKSKNPKPKPETTQKRKTKTKIV